MGPIILLDKSALQSLSHKEIDFLSRYYYVNIPPILIAEILADLTKESKATPSESNVRTLARKLRALNTKINGHYATALFNSLMGAPVPMKGVPVLEQSAKVIEMPDGSKGISIDEHPQRKFIRNWQNGIFSESDMEAAARWRQETQQLDFQARIEEARAVFGTEKPTIRSFAELGALVDNLLSNADREMHDAIINHFIKAVRATGVHELAIRTRWLMHLNKNVRSFAPYVFYCFRAFLLFHFGLISGLISPKPSNGLDLEYLFYLPFCQIFCSGDKLHKNLAHLLLREDQDFVDGLDMKNDLKWLVEQWEHLSEHERKKRIEDYGHYPPNNPDSLTYQMWKRHTRWKPGQKRTKLSKEEEKEIEAKARVFIEAAKKQKGDGEPARRT